MLVKTLAATKKKKRISNSKKFSIISYGCQMNVSDSEVVASILQQIGYSHTNELHDSDLILLNTCSIREKAELTVRKKLESINAIKKNNKNLKVGVLGCMAERLKERFLIEEKIVDLVVGPDAYRDLPNLLKEVEFGNDAVNVLLSKEETYAVIITKILKVLFFKLCMLIMKVYQSFFPELCKNIKFSRFYDKFFKN